MTEQTLSILKPDAVARNLQGPINQRLEQAGLKVVQQKTLQMTKEQAESFYAEHSHRPFYQDLCQYMSSGEIVAQVLEGDDAVACNRRVMGATNPSEAEEGTIRRDFGQSIDENTVHGSDSLQAAQREIDFFFGQA
jgi:nucleoside-diphosphate kinase